MTKYKLIKILFICLMVIATFNSAFADQAQIQISWNLPVDPPTDMIGIKISHNRTMIQDLPAAATGWTGQVDVVEGDNTFNVITYDTNGNESESVTVIKVVDTDPPPVTDVVVNIIE